MERDSMHLFPSPEPQLLPEQEEHEERSLVPCLGQGPPCLAVRAGEKGLQRRSFRKTSGGLVGSCWAAP